MVNSGHILMLIGWYGKSIRKLQSTQRASRGGVWEPSDGGIAAITRDAPPLEVACQGVGRRRSSNSQEGITQERVAMLALG